MIAVIQRVNEASVTIDNVVHCRILHGMLIFLGIEASDDSEDVKWLSNKLANLRIFDDENQVMNLGINEVDGEIVVVSQFTLHSSTKKGNRPSYIKAARPEVAVPLYELLLETLNTKCNNDIKSGIFGADMQVALVNDGPVTIIIDTKNKV